MERLNLEIKGMSCGHCVTSVRQALDGLSGVQVEDVRVGAARVAYDPARARPEAIVGAVNDEGYEAHTVPV